MNNKVFIINYNDKYYKKYKYLFNYSNIKFQLINNYILFNYLSNNNICNNLFKYSFEEQIYYNIIFYNKLNKKKYNYNPTIIYDDIIYFNEIFKIIINKNYNNKNLILTNVSGIIISIKSNKNFNILNDKIDCILYNNQQFTKEDIKNKNNYYKNMSSFYNFYSSHDLIIYKQFLINLKNNNEDNNVLIPKNKYFFITCYIGYDYGLSLTASYNMTLQLPHLISTISMALKNIVKNGTLILLWTIVNINIPIIKKILSILVYGFKNVEIIDNDINQNLLIGVPEYYIKCSGYKENISNKIINNLLDIAIEAIEYTYDTCDILDYYEDYTENNPNHSLFYNKTEENIKNRNRNKTLKSYSRSSSTSTRKSSTHKSSTHYTSQSKPITPIYYIEDINIPELDTIMKDSHLQFKVSVLSNKLEGIFIGYFEMVNNLILNSIAKDKNGNMYVKPEAILQKDITNLTKLIAMFEHNKLPYNKHALKVLLKKKDEVLDHFYSLDTPVNQKLIQYEDRTSKLLNKSAISNFKLSKSITKKYEYDILNEYYSRIKIANQVKNKLLEDVDFDNINNKYTTNTPKSVSHTIDEFSKGLSAYLNDEYQNTNKQLPVKINSSFLKLWEILSTFNLIPRKAESFKVLHLCEAPGQMILCAKHWASLNCHKIDMENNYEWLANSLNPYNYEARTKYIKTFGNVFSDNYGLIKDNYDKWLWGADNTGDITNVTNIKSIMNDVKSKMNTNIKTKLDLIISDGSLSIETNSLYIQKLDLAQLISVIACSTIGGACCVKHYIPYRNLNTFENNMNRDGRDDRDDRGASNTEYSSGYFINFLYMYYTLFDSISLYKPNTSNPNNGEFYVIGKGFRGVTEIQLTNLFKILENFTLNSNIIEKNKIPETFIMQINNFLESMSSINTLAIEKQNLLLTCYKNLGEDDKEGKYSETNKILKCENFLDEKKLDNMIIPKYKEWVKIFEFE